MEELKGYPVFQEPGLDDVLNKMIGGGERKVIGLFFDGNRFVMRDAEAYLHAKVKNAVGKISEQ